MYRDLFYDSDKCAVVTSSGIIIVPNVKDIEESFPLLNMCGELEKKLYEGIDNGNDIL
jgi:hypothetical protein